VEVSSGAGDPAGHQKRSDISVYYLDDFIGSHSDKQVLTAAYDDIRQTCATAGLIPNASKLAPPSTAVTVFNCDLQRGSAMVSRERVDKYYSQTDRLAASDEAFEDHRALVAAANVAGPI
jgi:hypothetical protein